MKQSNTVYVLLAATALLGISLGARAQQATIQENAPGFCGVQGTVDSNHTGYSGPGFANGNNAVGAGIDWSVNASASGVYQLEWRFANGSTSRPGSVKVNGATVTTVGFPSTGVWNSWTTVSTTANLNVGRNTIRLEATTSTGLANIDSLAVTGGGDVQAAACDGGTAAAPNVSHRGTSTLTTIGHRVVTYTGYMNGESFQQEGIRTFNGWQYAVFWDSSSYVNISRRQLPSGAWQNIRFTDYRTSSTDSHNVISMGISHLDGTIHLAFDMHNSPMRYRISKPGAALNPAGTAWTASLFSATSSTLKGQGLPSSLTYPAFISSPGGMLQMTIRNGASGGGDQLLYEYNGAGSSGAWTSLGTIIEGGTANAYMFGQEYGPDGCLHMSWNWRQTSNASTNHDLLYAYSCDEGRTWRNNAGATIATTGNNPLSAGSSGVRVWAIGQNRGLINQESMIIDANGFVHVIASHMPDSQPNDSDFTRARAKSVVMHYFRNPSTRGWTRRVTPFVEHSARSDVVADSSGNLYVVSGDDTTKRLHIETASAASGWSDWTLKWTSSSIYFSDPLLDHWRTKTENTISIFQPRWNSGTIDVLDWNVIP